MSSRGICPHARRAALEAYRDPTIMPVETLLPAQWPQTQDGRIHLENRLKPHYYGRLGIVINRAVSMTVDTPLPPSGRLRSPLRGKFGALYKAIDAHILAAATNVIDQDADEPYMKDLLNTFTLMTGLSPTRHATLADSLRGGAATAAGAAVDNLEALYRPLARTMLPDRIGRLRNSYAPLIGQASLNPYQSSLVLDNFEQGVHPLVAIPEPGHRLDYAEPVTDMPMTDAHRFKLMNMSGDPQREAEAISDVADPIDTIGCPILLEPGQAKRYWNWVIDEALRCEVIKPEA